MERLISYKFYFSRKEKKEAKKQSFFFFAPLLLIPLRLCMKITTLLCAFLFFCVNSFSQNDIRKDFILSNNWLVSLGETSNWKNITVPNNLDDYYGYRRLLHGNLHGDAVYKNSFGLGQFKKDKRFFLFFEGVGSYAKVFINNQYAGIHAGGRTSFTLDITEFIKTDGSRNEIKVNVSHPGNVKDLPWVCGACSDDRGFSEGSQPMGIFRPVHLIVTNEIRVEPFGVHVWADIKNDNASLSVNTTLKNYAQQNRDVFITQQLVDAAGKIVATFSTKQELKGKDSVDVLQPNITIDKPILWSAENPHLYKIITLIKENNIVIDKTETDFGFRTINWKTASHQFLLNGKPVFINGIAEYEHLLGQSHAFSNEQIIARMKWIQSAGFNALRDAHQPHNLLYGKLCDEKGLLWWTQFSAHIWYDTPEFRNNFKTLLREWVIERRNDPAVILWGLQNESKLPKDFAEECTVLIRSLDPTASSERLVTTCNGGEGTDWDVPQNWTGTYGGDPATYANDIKKQILIGEYGAWRTLDLHTEGGFKQNGILSENRMTQLMEQKIRLAESVKDSVAGQFFWLLTSHDNPGRVQGGEGLRELDRVGPVNYKGLLTPWEEPTDAYYMFRSNYVSAKKEPIVYIVSHTWPNRWMTSGIKDSIIVYSNCEEVELFNDIDNASLGKQKKYGIGTHFQWDKVDIRYNVLYAVGYINGKAVARDTITLFHLPQSPNYNRLYANAINITKPKSGYQYVHRINCGGGIIKDENGNTWWPDGNNFSSWTADFEDMPKNFASQRRTFAPVKNSKDWKLFQTFRYGKDKLQFDFDVEDGDYLVELYFIEPWLGNGGINAKGMRIFDVAINGKTVINDLDIWNAAGANTVVKKSFFAKAVNEKIVISFPQSKVGQALISAIAIAKKGEHVNRRTAAKRSGSYQTQSWLDIGDKQFENASVQFNSLPSNLFGADWIQLKSKEVSRVFEHEFYSPADLFLSIKDGEKNTDLLKGFENTNTQIITDENGGTTYNVFRKRFEKDDTISIHLNSNLIVCMQPVNNMQPAYDLKAVAAYRTNIAEVSGAMQKENIAGRECAVAKNMQSAIVQWPIQTGVADIYSITMKYFYEKEQTVKGKLQLFDAGNVRMLEVSVSFTFTLKGKWNQFTINTGTQVNAGNYTVKLIVDNAEGLAISGIEVQ